MARARSTTTVLETIAVVGPAREIAAKLRARLDGIADGVSLTHNRAPDPEHWADVVAELKRSPSAPPASGCPSRPSRPRRVHALAWISATCVEFASVAMPATVSPIAASQIARSAPPRGSDWP